MTEACQHLHDVLSRAPHYKREDLEQIPKNGIYILFEKGETAHGGERIVRIGTHRGQNILPGRMREHLYTPNKDRSIFRKHVGRCLLNRAHDPFLSQWNYDRTTKAARALTSDSVRLQEIETEVTAFMVENFSFAVLHVGTKAERLDYEERLLSTVYQCPDCGSSEGWLGRHHPSRDVIRNGGLWNVQGLSGKALSIEQAKRILQAGMGLRSA